MYCRCRLAGNVLYSTIPTTWNIKSAPAIPGRSRFGPALYVLSLSSSNQVELRLGTAWKGNLAKPSCKNMCSRKVTECYAVGLRKLDNG